jgi:hypothetical protein
MHFFSGAYLGFNFGNLEILIVLFAVIAWIAGLLGVPLFGAFFLSAVLGSAPAILGLASTVKGDLLACTAFLMAFGWLIQLKEGDRSPLVFGIIVLSVTLSLGSKISVLLPAITILIFATALMGRSITHDLWQLPILIRLGLVAILFIFSSRLWTNWVVYGNPLIRIEHVQFSFVQMLANMELAADRMFAIGKELQGKGQMWALSGSMGGTAWFIVICVILSLPGAAKRFRRSTPYQSASTDTPAGGLSNSTTAHDLGVNSLAKIGLPIFIATAASMALSDASLALLDPSLGLSDAAPWAFRYFLPGVMVLLLGIGAITLSKDIFSGSCIIIAFISILTIAVNIGITSRPGEVLPTIHFDKLVTMVQQANTPLKRISLMLKGPYQAAEVENLGLDAKPMRILTFNGLGEPLIPFLGSHAQNRIRTVANEKDLIFASTQAEWDVVAILLKKNLRDPIITRQLIQQGYFVVVDNGAYLIALPESRIKLTPLINLSEIKWTPWNPMAGATLSVQGGLPKVKSIHPVDTGFVSQEISFDKPTVIMASFEGEIAGSGTHAAHLSVHGKQRLITLPAGKYSKLQSFQEILPPIGDMSLQRLSFGLGGWTEGKGRLRLTNLDIFQWRIVKVNEPVGTFESQIKQ